MISNFKNNYKVEAGNPLYFIILTLILLTSCRKDKVSTECKDVDYSPLYQYGGVTEINKKTKGERLKTPMFNPNNDSEIMFVREQSGTQDKQIYIYNLVNSSKELIFEGEVLGRPRWGGNDYIIFYRMGGHIWKIRSDGQNLTYVNNPMEVYDPQWNSTGTKFAANAPIYQAPNQLIVFDENGAVLDSFPLPITENYVGSFNSQSSFKREDVLVLRRSEDIRFYDLENEEIIATIHTQLGFSNLTGAGGNIFWLDSTNLIYGNRDGVHQITFPELQNTHLIKSCTDKVYISGAINDSKTKMVWGVKEEKVMTDEFYVQIKYYLVLMNIDGSNEQKIEIDF